MKITSVFVQSLTLGNNAKTVFLILNASKNTLRERNTHFVNILWTNLNVMETGCILKTVNAFVIIFIKGIVVKCVQILLLLIPIVLVITKKNQHHQMYSEEQRKQEGRRFINNRLNFCLSSCMNANMLISLRL